MQPTEEALIGLMILGGVLMLVGWFLTLGDPIEDHNSIVLLGILLPFLAPWVISAFHYRDLKGAFWTQTIGACLITGGALLYSAVH